MWIGFTLKRVRDMLKRHSQCTAHISTHSTAQPLVEGLNGWLFVYELSGGGFQSRCRQLIFRYHACFEQEVPWHSGNYRRWIPSERRTWHDKNTQVRFAALILAFNIFQAILLSFVSIARVFWCQKKSRKRVSISIHFNGNKFCRYSWFWCLPWKLI